MKSFETFLQLHKKSTPLLLGNIWDVNSARIFESRGFKGIGTSSQAVAKSLGYEDGERMPFDSLLQLAKRVVAVVNIPFTVDMEAGYSRSITGIIENIKKLHEIGVVGINLEDTVPGDPRLLKPVADFQKILSAVAEHIIGNSLKMFLNIRTDGFLLGMPTALTETLIRIKSYENAGAHGIFVPCITDKNDIKEVVNATNLPVNVMCMPDLPNFDELKLLGVKRISTGPFVNSYTNKKMEEVVSTILHDNNFSGLFRLIPVPGCFMAGIVTNREPLLFIFKENLVTQNNYLGAALVLGLSFLLTNCNNSNSNSSADPNLEEAKKAIAASNAVYFESFVKNDSSVFINSYAKDACIMSPGSTHACGPEEAAKFFRAAYTHYGMRNGKFITTAVYGNGAKYVTEEGLWQSFNAKGQLFDDGKYLVLWKKTPEGWKMFRDAFSSNRDLK